MLILIRILVNTNHNKDVPDKNIIGLENTIMVILCEFLRQQSAVLIKNQLQAVEV